MLDQANELPKRPAQGVLLATAFCGNSFAWESSPPATVSIDLSGIEQILKQTGATSTELAAFEEDMSQASAADVAEYEKYLRAQSPSELISLPMGCRLFCRRTLTTVPLAEGAVEE
jgi:hypothetical protein